jgi:hypothetical protein
VFDPLQYHFDLNIQIAAKTAGEETILAQQWALAIGRGCQIIVLGTDGQGAVDTEI